MNDKQAALIKLAQVRCAINHVLRMRAMKKQARDPDWQRNLELTDEMNGAVGTSTPLWVKGMNGTLSKDKNFERYRDPENSSTFWSLFPFGGLVSPAQQKTKRMLKQQAEGRKALGMPQDPYKDYEEPSQPVVPPTDHQSPLPPGTLQLGGLFPFR